MLKKLAIIVVVAIVGVLAYAATRPDVLRVERSIAIHAPPERIFPLVNDYRQWMAWSPYEAKDPAMSRTFGATTAGTGATYAWAGNKEVGKGRMTIEASAPPTRVDMRVDFLEPLATTNKVAFTLAPEAGATRVTWTMDCPLPFVAKLMQLVFDLDRIIGADFETGLANLKHVAEKA